MTKNENNSWKGFLTIFIIWAIIHFGHDTIIDFATNIKDTKPIIDTQIVNNTFKITDQKVKCDIFDYFFNVSRITGTALTTQNIIAIHARIRAITLKGEASFADNPGVAANMRSIKAITFATA